MYLVHVSFINKSLVQYISDAYTPVERDLCTSLSAKIIYYHCLSKYTVESLQSGYRHFLEPQLQHSYTNLPLK